MIGQDLAVAWPKCRPGRELKIPRPAKAAVRGGHDPYLDSSAARARPGCSQPRRRSYRRASMGDARALRPGIGASRVVHAIIPPSDIIRPSHETTIGEVAAC